MSTMNIVGFVFVVLAIIAALVASGLSWDEAYGWAAGIYLLSAVLFLIAGVFFAMGRRGRSAGPSPYGPR